MSGKPNIRSINSSFLTRIFTSLCILICLGLPPSSSHGIGWRIKRGSPTIADLPQIIPPRKLKKGESKSPSPGWTHCIKYLKADVRWRSIRSVNLKHLQASQFQCSWFIESEIPGYQLRLSFEKVDLGASETCKQQFLELIDIAVGKSQGRFCGNKKIGDYVTVGQRARIDIHGEEDLVEKVRGNKEPFIISYKMVKEPAGFRINQPKGDVALRNKVKVSVGTMVDKSRTIYGSNNQPGKSNKDTDEKSGRHSSLSIWQVVIIIVVCMAFIAIVVGVIIKRMIFDKKKEQEYLDLEANQNSLILTNSVEKPLPGLIINSSHTSQKQKSSDENKNNVLNSIGMEVIGRSSSKPEGGEHRTHKMKRHNSHGDLTISKEGASRDKRHYADEEAGVPVLFLPTRAPKERKKKGVGENTNIKTMRNSSVEVSLSKRPSKKPHCGDSRDPNKSNNDQKTKRSKSHHERKARAKDANANNITRRTCDTSTISVEKLNNGSPPTRVKQKSKKQSHSSKAKRNRTHKTKPSSNHPSDIKRTDKKAVDDINLERTKADETAQGNKRKTEKQKSRKTEVSKTKRESTTTGASKKRKTVSSAHKKTLNSGKKSEPPNVHSSHHSKKTRTQGKKEGSRSNTERRRHRKKQKNDV